MFRSDNNFCVFIVTNFWIENSSFIMQNSGNSDVIIGFNWTCNTQLSIHIDFTTLNWFNSMTCTVTVNFSVRNFHNKTHFGKRDDYNSQSEIILESKILKSRISKSLLSGLLNNISKLFIPFIVTRYLEPFPEPTCELDFRFIAQ